ncbi:G kinase-anchoring protein 1-A [Bienertia sinuspersici]
MVARDHTNKMLMAKGRTIIKIWDAESVKVAAGDAQLIMKALQGESSGRGAVQLLIDDALTFKSSFNSCIFNFCYRENNEVANCLSKWAMHSFCDEVWLDDSPPWLLDVITSNLPIDH